MQEMDTKQMYDYRDRRENIGKTIDCFNSTRSSYLSANAEREKRSLSRFSLSTLWPGPSFVRAQSCIKMGNVKEKRVFFSILQLE